MNHIHRIVWSAARGAFVVAHELARSGGKTTTTRTQSANLLPMALSAQVTPVSALALAVCLAMAAVALPATSWAQTAANTLPTGGQVVGGVAAGSIATNGNAMTIAQNQQRMVANWNSFSIGSAASVNFQQPTGGVALNRVTGAEPSEIFGRLTSNGSVYLVNPNGVLFGRTAQVDVGSLVASTQNMADADFMAGKTLFSRNGATGSVVNEGQINATLGGYVALLAPEVRNSGIIVARMGTVAMAAGDVVELQFDGGKLANVRVDPATIATLIDNRSAVQAPDGHIILSAPAVSKLQGSAIKNSGTLDASSLSMKGGRIVLSADSIELSGTSVIDASGATGGGTVLVGGDWQGSNGVYQATTVTMAEGAKIDASAKESGDGGKVVLWSDIHKPESTTRVDGEVKATGGHAGGDGGQIETSGASVGIGEHASFNTLAPQGTTGLWLLDPYDYTIDTAQAQSIASGLRTTNVSITTSSNDTSYGSGGNSGNVGNITVNAAIDARTGVLSKLALTNGGSGYLTAPVVTLSGGGGTGATATAVISGGVVTGINITSAGYGYTSAPTVVFSGGSGTGAAATATALLPGQLASISVVNGGSGYTSAPTVALSGGGGSGATATALLSNGVVTGFDITAVGSGYTTAPTITLSGGAGTGASATSTVPLPSANTLSMTAAGEIAVNAAITVGSLSLSGNSAVGKVGVNLANNITTTGAQTYTGNVAVSGDSILTSQSAGVTFYGSLNNLAGAQLLTGSSSWTIPVNVTSVKVWAIGAGGGGSGATTNDSDSGGGGAAGGVAYKTYTTTPGQSISYSSGAAGTAGTGGNNGSAGGTTSVTYSGTSMTATGGGGGLYQSTINATGGTGSGGDGAATGGAGLYGSGDNGGGGGGGIGGLQATVRSSNGSVGAVSSDVSGLNTALRMLGWSIGTGAGALPATNSGGLNNAGGNATGFGSGGGGGAYWGGNGGSGLYGGGGGGASGNGSTWTGGAGGSGAVVVQYSVAPRNLTINAGAGNVNFASTVGDIANMAGLTVNTTGNITFSSTASVAALSTTGGTNTTFNGAVKTAGAVNMTGNAIAINNTLDATASNIAVNADALTFGASGRLQSTGWLSVAPRTLSNTIGLGGAAGTLQLPTSYFSTNFVNGFTGITVGGASVSGKITVGAVTTNDPLTLQNTTGGIEITGALNAQTDNLTLNSSGAVTDTGSGYLSANGLLLLGGGTVTLDSTSNAITTLAANTGGVGLLESNGFTVGTVGSTSGVASTGMIDLATQSGNLTIEQAISTSSTGSSAISINAAKNTAAGSSANGNVLISGSPGITTGTGGRAVIYTGSVSGSTGVTALVGSASGRFRYNSDENSAGYDTTNAALGAGLYALYRERPTVTFTVANDTMVYGGTVPSLPLSVSSGVNGDTVAQIFQTAPTLVIGGATSAAGYYTAGSHTLSVSGSGTGRLGYTIGTISGSATLTVTKAPVTLSGATGITKTYDGTTAMPGGVTPYGSLGGVLGSDAVVISGSPVFNSANVSAGSSGSPQNILQGGVTLLGADASNYQISWTNGSGYITPKALTLSGLVATNKIYDGSLTASISNYGSLSGVVGSDTVTRTNTGTALFSQSNVGNNLAVTVSGLTLSNSNYSIGDQTGYASITPKALMISGLTASDKTYDATTTASVVTSGLSYGGIVSGDAGNITLSNASGVFDTKNAGTGKTVSLSYTLGGSALGNYSVTHQTSTSASITPKTLTLSGATGITKTYDGTSSMPTGEPGYVSSGAGSLAGIESGDTVTLSGRAAFDSANVVRVGGVVNGAVTNQNIVQGTVSLSGADAGNYSLSWTNGSGTINPATLTLTANSAAKFVTQADPVFTASYNGFVNGETASTAGLTGTLAFSRSASGPDGNTSGSNELAGAYTGAITASGLSANNYTLAYVSGDFNIVGAGSLLVRATGTSTYGTSVGYSITSASYWNPSGAGSEVTLSNITANGNNNFTVDDGAGASATFTLAPQGASTSTSGNLKAGSYQLSTSGTVTTVNASNFNNSLIVTGAHQVNQAGLTAVVNAAAKTKTYDGNADMLGLNLSATAAGAVTSDLVSLSGSGAFSNKNVSRDGNNALAANKSYTVSGISLSGTDAGNYYLSSTSLTGSDGQITPKTLTVTYTGVDKVYDGGTTATVTTSDNRITGDNLSIARTANFVSAGSEAAKSVVRDGNGDVIAKNINVTSVSLSGTDALNYALASTTGSASAKITPAELVVSGITASDKTYDRTNAAALNTGSLLTNGKISGDTVNVAISGSFGDANAGQNKTVTLSSSYSGADVSNYTITDQTQTVASIAQRPVQVSANGVSKVYDGTTAMTGVTMGLGAVSGVTDSGIVSGDTVTVTGIGTFSSKNVGTGKTYTLSGLALSNANYVISGGASSINGSDGAITARSLDVTFTGVDKVYDATSSASLSASYGNAAHAPVIGDVVTVAASASFADPNVNAVGSPASIAIGVPALSGNDAGNYSLGTYNASTTANITPRLLTVGYTGVSRVYNGGTSVNFTSSDNRLNNDAFDVVGTADFLDKNVGNGKTINISGVYLSGAKAANYSVASTGSTSANISALAITVTAPTVSKVYDGTTDVLSGAATLSSLATGDAVGIAALLTYDTRFVGTNNKTVTPSGLVIRDSGSTDVTSNYAITYVADAVSSITPKALTISGLSSQNKVYDGSTWAAANGSAVLQTASVAGQGNASDGKAYSGDDVSLSGLAVGTFNSKNVWEANAVSFTGLSLVGTEANNYTLTSHTTATQSIIPKSVTVSGLGTQNKVYDGDTTATVLGTASVGSVSVRSGNINDGLFYTGDSVQLSGTPVGNFNTKDVATATTVGFSGLSLSGTDARNYDLLAHPDAQASIGRKSVTLTAPSVSRPYDGSSNYSASSNELSVLSSQLGVSGDTISHLVLTYNDKNVATGKVLTPSLAAIADGQGGDNYTLSYVANNSSSITRLNSVAWVGGSTGNWFDPGNWAGGAVPDLANVANVAIPTGVMVLFDNTYASGSASGGTVQIDGLGTAQGGLSMQVGTLQVGSGGVTLGTLSQTGGALTSTGSMSVGTFNQTGGTAQTSGGFSTSVGYIQSGSGTLTVGGGTTMGSTNGNVTVGNLTTSALQIDSHGGGVGQAAGTTISSGSTTVTARNGNAPADINLGNAGNDLGGTVSTDGANVTLRDDTGGLTLGTTTATGALAVTSNGGNVGQASGTSISSGSTTVTARHSDNTAANIDLGNAGNNIGGTVSTDGANVTLRDDTGGLTLGATMTTGGLTVGSNGGGVGQAAGTSISSGSTTVTARHSDNTAADIDLGNAGNNIGGAVSTDGANVSLRDDTGGLTLGNTVATGNLVLESHGGGIDQAAGAALNVTGTAQVTARNGNSPADISLENPDNRFTGLLTADGHDVNVNTTGSLGINVTASGDAMVQAAGDLRAALAVTGQASLTTGDNLDVGGRAGSLQATSEGGVNFRELSLGGAVSVSAKDDITQSGPLSVGGQANFKSENGTLILSGSNSFTGGLIREDNVSRSSAATVVSAISGTGNVPGLSTVTPSLSNTVSVKTDTGSAVAVPDVSNRFASSGISGTTVVVALKTGAEQSSVSTGFVSVRSFDPVAAPTGMVFSFTLPKDTFRPVNPQMAVSLEASRADGQPLPDWLKFDAGTGRFTGQAPEGVREMEIRVTAHAAAGGDASTKLMLRFGDANH